MRRKFQTIILTFLCMLCVNIVTAQNVRQKPVVKKQATTTTKKQTTSTVKKQSTATTSKQQKTTAKQQTTKSQPAVKGESKKVVADTPASTGISVRQNNIKVHETTSENYDDKVFDVVEQMPSFPGGNGKLSEFLSQNVRYPVVAVENGIEGRVIVRFIVERDGSVSNVEVAKGAEASLDKEAVRVVKMMPKWNPGKQNGKAVRVNFNVPISFKLQGSSSSKSSTITVRGRVVDKHGEPIIGASIIEEGTRKGAVSDFDGNFSMDVPKSGETKLNVSYVGHKTKSVKVDKNNNTPLKIVLK